MDEGYGYVLEVLTEEAVEQWDELTASELDEMIMGYAARDDHRWRIKAELRYATVFPTIEESHAVAEQLSRGPLLSGMYSRLAFSHRQLDKESWLTIRRHQLREEAAARFGLKRNTPYAIVADRYEDEGMTNEASILRRKT